MLKYHLENTFFKYRKLLRCCDKSAALRGERGEEAVTSKRKLIAIQHSRKEKVT